jgi:hypothetical protein
VLHKGLRNARLVDEVDAIEGGPSFRGDGRPEKKIIEKLPAPLPPHVHRVSPEVRAAIWWRHSPTFGNVPAVEVDL